MPPPWPMKSMCQKARRNSPSVMPCSPIASCLAITAAMALVLDGTQIVGRDLAALVPQPGVLDGGGTQQAADLIGAKRRLGSRHGRVSSRCWKARFLAAEIRERRMSSI